MGHEIKVCNNIFMNYNVKDIYRYIYIWYDVIADNELWVVCYKT